MCSGRAFQSFGALTENALSLAIPKLRKRLGRISKFKQSLIWHHHIEDHVRSCHLTKLDTFRVNRDFENWFQDHTNVFSVETAYSKTI